MANEDVDETRGGSSEVVESEQIPGVEHDEVVSPADDGFDAAELVGPGRYPLRIQPAAALLPGSGDSLRLMVTWFVRKSFYWLFFLGWAVGSLVAYWSGDDVEFDVNLTSPDSVREGLLSPWAALLLALIIRFVNGWVALGLAFPLAVGHEPGLSDRTNFGSGVGKFFDRLHVARAFRALRWTHHVRQIALKRLGRTGRRLGTLDPVIDVLNIVSGAFAFGVIFYVASRTA